MYPATRFLLLVLLAAAAAPCARACVGYKVAVSVANPNPAKAAQDPSSIFDLDGVREHFDHLVPITEIHSNTKSTFSCVDSRGDDHQLGTLGGDFAELATGIYKYLKLTSNSTLKEISEVLPAVQDIFKAFMIEVASPSRPFYFHTSDEKLRKVFDSLKKDGYVERKPTIFPEMMPTDPKTQEAWLKKLATGSYQGCGHVRLMIDQFADYGLTSPAVPQALVKAFYKYWWSTAPGSEQRSKIQFNILQGPLDGRAIAVVDSAGACPGQSAAAVPAHGGSQIFVYHGKAVDEFRQQTLTPFFVKYAKKHGKTLDADKYYNELKSLQGKQLGATLTYLAPANTLPLWAVTVTLSDSAKAATDSASSGASGPKNAAQPK